MALQYPYPADRFILVGTVIRSHGLKGEFKVTALWGPPETYSTYSRVALVATDGRMTELLEIKRCRVQGKHVILKLDTIDSKNEADLIASMGVLLSLEDAVGEKEANESLDEPPYHLIGSSVFTTTGDRVGELVNINQTGGHPLLIIMDNNEEYLVPFVDKIVVGIDNGRIIIDPPPGLLEVNQSPESQ